MSKQVKSKAGKKVQPGERLPLKRENYILFGVGMLLIVLGYVALAHGPWDSFLSLTLAPILLFLGYVVVIPVSILYRKKEKKEEEAGPGAA